MYKTINDLLSDNKSPTHSSTLQWLNLLILSVRSVLEQWRHFSVWLESIFLDFNSLSMEGYYDWSHNECKR